MQGLDLTNSRKRTGIELFHQIRFELFHHARFGLCLLRSFQVFHKDRRLIIVTNLAARNFNTSLSLRHQNPPAISQTFSPISASKLQLPPHSSLYVTNSPSPFPFHQLHQFPFSRFLAKVTTNRKCSRRKFASNRH
jgi:hypothetical protein